MKVAQRDEMKERQQRKREGIAPEDPDTDPEGAAQEDVDAQTMGDLFGSDDPVVMDVG
jgi:transcription initiation factor TFIID subunit 7